MSHPTTYRSETAYWLTLLFAIAWGGYCLVYGALVAIGGMAMGHRTLTGGERISAGVMYLVLAAAGWATWWFLGRTCVIVDDDTVVVRNPIRRYALRRSEIARITTTFANGWVILVTTSGKRISVFGLSYGFRWTLRRRMAAFSQQLGIEGPTASTP